MAIGPDGLRWGFTSMVPDALPALPGRQWQRAGGSARFYTLLHACTRMAFAYRRRPRPCKAATMAGPATLPPSVTAGQSYHPDAGQENRRLLQACRRLTMQFLLSFRGVSCSDRPSLTLIHPGCRPSRNWG